jgi:hypothetical protein
MLSAEFLTTELSLNFFPLFKQRAILFDSCLSQTSDIIVKETISGITCYKVLVQVYRKLKKVLALPLTILSYTIYHVQFFSTKYYHQYEVWIQKNVSSKCFKVRRVPQKGTTYSRTRVPRVTQQIFIVIRDTKK